MRQVHALFTEKVHRVIHFCMPFKQGIKQKLHFVCLSV